MSDLHQRKPSSKKQPVSNDTDVDALAYDKASTSGIAVGSIVRTLLMLLVFFFFSSYVITDTWLWGYEGKWSNPRQWFPKTQVFTEEELLQYTGKDPSLPIYIAINGEVYDVTEGRDYYGPGGSYHFFAGRDAARAYITGCFDTHLTHDLRGLSSDQLKQLDGWRDFYRNSHKYYLAGRVIHPAIPKDAPIPEDCDNAAGQKP
ncbi:cytochrome b5-like heme/steroid binding domain-containing protein [Syncephalis plumigaleata]|nr:cytochrome b5-like heme/steroid binding domain-containing protein [Syncephalis plumigaleata]